MSRSKKIQVLIILLLCLVAGFSSYADLSAKIHRKRKEPLLLAEPRTEGVLDFGLLSLLRLPSFKLGVNFQ